MRVVPHLYHLKKGRKCVFREKNRAGDGNRTHVSSLEGWRTSHCTTPAYTSSYDARARDGDRTRDPLLGKEVLHR